MSDFVKDTNVPTNDLISRQAAIDEMATWDWQEVYLPIHFKQLLEELPSAQQWIPVSERLPNGNDRVLVCGKRGGIQIARFLENNDYGGGHTHTFWLQGNRTIDAICWMPLPKPYKEEDDDRNG